MLFRHKSVVVEARNRIVFFSSLEARFELFG